MNRIGLGSPETPERERDNHAPPPPPPPLVARRTSTSTSADAPPPATQSSSTAPRQATKRGRYVTRACLHCQKRKVKCSGGEVCEQCVSANLDCVYNVSGRKRRRPADAPLPAVDEVESVPRAATLPAASPSLPVPSGFVEQVMARLAVLEQDRDRLREQLREQREGQRAAQYETPQSVAYASSLPETGAFHGATSILESIETVSRNVAHEASSTALSRAQSPLPASYDSITWRSLPRGTDRDISTLEKEMKTGDVAGLYRSLDTFFQFLNCHYPCLNENQVRGQVERFMSDSGTGSSSDADRYQFICLLYLIQAEVKILSDDWASSSMPPAWDEFCRADSILDRLTWLGNGNLLTVQCLLLKARCIFYLEKGEAACEAMAKVVRLVFLLGLHNQPSWGEISPFEMIMRQRTVWTVYYLERHIAFNCGVPYLMRDSDMNVALPGRHDDKLLFPDSPLPPEAAPEESFSTYLSLAVKWCKLSAEIWDAVFSVTVRKPTSDEFLASMDARIEYLTSQFPAFLQWDQVAQDARGSSTLPAYVPRQATILRLRSNQLRLLLRQEEILSMKYDLKTAEDYVNIAANTIHIICTQDGADMHKLSRWSAVLYLMSTLPPLVCVVIRNDNSKGMRAAAIDAYKRGLAVLHQLAPTFSSARHSLKRIHRIVGAAKRAIRRFQESEASWVEQRQTPISADQALFDFDFFTADTALEPENDKFDEMLTELFPVPTYGNPEDQYSTFWMGSEFLNGQ